ncbi:AlbA family DNA-binding domain-containing protein [Desulfobacter latus]|uniref:Putative DNA binding domain-containing protein n=1 Tax=Desulfobacter latus TaxID=2292 RepID=A0A850TDQ2_9BACT|nr:RNA-binding domain-containing protein [Desulfobacter latus]NWH05566.1 putative DNA binding domain-containing protein [Desulfobacter latus]
MKTIEKIIQLQESKVLEFKRDISSFKPILKTIVAFANTAGGTIVIGVDDDKTVIGIEDVLQAEESLASSISDGIMPGMMPEIEIVSFQGVHLLLIKVARWRGPFYLKSQGPEQGVYIRLGSTNRKAGDEILKELKRSSSGIYFDQMPCIGTNETEFIKRNTRLYSKIESFHREDIPSYPEIAVREVLINSLAHTDYSIKGMRIFGILHMTSKVLYSLLGKASTKGNDQKKCKVLLKDAGFSYQYFQTVWKFRILGCCLLE